MKKHEVTQLMSLIGAAYPGVVQRMNTQELNATLEVYENLLMDLEYDLARRAVLSHLATCKWWPSIAELRKRATELKLKLPDATVALEMVREYADVSRRNGGSARFPLPNLPRPVARALNQCGGLWEMNNNTNQTAWRSQFRKAYEALRDAELRNHNEVPLLLESGLMTEHEAQKLIGDGIHE